MEYIYWIQRLGILSNVCWAVFGLSLTACLILGIYLLVEGDDCYEDTKREKRYFKTALILGTISLIGGVFVPTEKELYAIYGIGGTIDYIKDNDTAKQLPDKVINVLDAWVDKQLEENKEGRQNDE